MYNFSLRENNNVKKTWGKQTYIHLVTAISLSKAPSEESEAEKGAWLNCA